MDFLFICLTAFIFFIGCFVAYFKIRPLFPVHVNCWFCCHDTKVPYGNRNCWDCPNCEQYNGFDNDGGYNKPVPAQYTEEINHPVSCSPAEFLSRGEFLCRTCQRNQLLKIKQLAAFEPLNEAMYDDEIAFYRRHLETVYALCPTCESTVQRELQRMDDTLQQLHGPSLSENVGLSEKQAEEINSQTRPSSQKRPAECCLHLCALTTFVCALLVFCAELCNYLPKLGSPLEEVACLVLRDDFTLSCLGMLGLTVCIATKLLLGKDRLLPRDAVHILVWLARVLTAFPEFGIVFVTLPKQSICPQPVLSALLLLCEVVTSFSQRRQINATTPVIKRLSLEGKGSSASSEAVSEAVSSVSTSCRRRLIPDRLHDDGDKSSHLSFNSMPSGSGREAVKSELGVSSGRGKATKSEPHLCSGGGQAEKSDLDVLGNGLCGFSIGKPPSESGYSTGSAGNSVFGQSSFATTTTAGFSAGVSFPRPLISPARLSHVRFSTSAEPSLPSGGISPRSTNVFSGTQFGKPQSDGQYNIFLAQDSRPHSMFANPTPVLRKCFKQDLLSGIDKVAGQDVFGQAPVFTGLSPKEPFPQRHAFTPKTEIPPPSRPLKKPIKDSWWRDSSDVGEKLKDETMMKTSKTKFDQDEDRASEVECDSTTPNISQLTLNSDLALHRNTASRRRKVQPSFPDSMEVSDNEEEPEDAHDSSSVGAFAGSLRKTKSSASFGLLFAVSIAVVSLAANILLAWSVLGSR